VEKTWETARLLFVGRLVHQKGLDLLLKALRDLRELHWELTIVGDGVLRDELQASLDHFNISERVHFVGWQRDEDLVRYYQQANLFILPSRHEGMPNVILEAMASGLPVIASNIPGNEELVLYETTGLLFPTEDVDSLRGALHTLIQDPGQRASLGEASRRRVVENYTWRRTAQGYMDIFIRKGEAN
jgi:glycosyltransferase involved in cell wall biosynthesis